ncbi:membrane-spanning 4-domains subfamily A member 3 [Hippopotamus amphibius kiboko]|uniref:membrane-spanning 4-domains subfamily A member 3 n=1 Tax=Hippopotamus amphibius kiboko TaxID=575201 RepID=UPI002593E1B5|nr:membrane-spanning 4-domains subfamily A member 3 [Hippopotamus amphibius kiboko]
MASQGVDSAELGTASAGSAPGSQVEPQVENISVYQPTNRSQNYQEKAIQMLSGAITPALGVLMSSLNKLLQNEFELKMGLEHRAYALNPKAIVTLEFPGLESNLGMNISSATIVLVGLVFLSVNLSINDPLFKNCQPSHPPDLCIYKEVSSSE